MITYWTEKHNKKTKLTRIPNHSYKFSKPNAWITGWCKNARISAFWDTEEEEKEEERKHKKPFTMALRVQYFTNQINFTQPKINFTLLQIHLRNSVFISCNSELLFLIFSFWSLFLLLSEARSLARLKNRTYYSLVMSKL